MRVHIATLCGLAPCRACTVSCLLSVVTSLLRRAHLRSARSTAVVLTELPAADETTCRNQASLPRRGIGPPG